MRWAFRVRIPCRFKLIRPMTLGYSTEIYGKPTRFMEKVLKGYKGPVTQEVANAFHHPKFSEPDFKLVQPKIHTIREDRKNLWKVGMDIHMVIGNRTKNRFQFAPIVKVVSIQTVEILYKRFGKKTIAVVKVDGVIVGQAAWLNCQLTYYSDNVKSLVVNDGFDSINEFFEWFSEDFEGKIIHWTDLKY